MKLEVIHNGKVVYRFFDYDGAILDKHRIERQLRAFPELSDKAAESFAMMKQTGNRINLRHIEKEHVEELVKTELFDVFHYPEGVYIHLV